MPAPLFGSYGGAGRALSPSPTPPHEPLLTRPSAFAKATADKSATLSPPGEGRGRGEGRVRGGRAGSRAQGAQKVRGVLSRLSAILPPSWGEGRPGRPAHGEAPSHCYNVFQRGRRC